MTRTLVKTDNNGTKYFKEECKCLKCAGRGTLSWTDYAEGRCFDCNGTGIVEEIVKEYTEEHKAKLDAQRAKRMEKRMAEHAAEIAEQEAINAEIQRKEEEKKAQREAEKAKSQYIGSVGDKITVTVTLMFEASYDTKFGTTYIYSFRDDEGNTLVWKTTSSMVLDEYDARGYVIFVQKGDKVTFSATIKDHTEYKGEKQTVIQRVRKISMVSKKQEKTDEEKAEEQMASIKEGDQIWDMPYRQYKDHYRDCETVAGSYDEDRRTIKVIIRAGRMKASGVRGEHYAGYEFKNEKGELATYRAVSFENALARCEKEFPDDKWKINHIYFYERH